jgi:iron complex transport system ATP-binding protein
VRVQAERMCWEADGRAIVSAVDLDVTSGETVGLVGPNGSGKSSVLRCLAGLRTPSKGAVRYDGQDIVGWSSRRIAQHLAYVEQASDTDSDLQLVDVVALGRMPFRDRWRALSHSDRVVVEAAVSRLGLTGLETRHWRTLSGGERQRAHIARALALQPWCIVLDEPTNHLDVRHQLDLLEFLADTDQTVVVALHDLSLAARYCDRLVLLHQGVVAASGRPGDVLSPVRLRDYFGVHAETGRDCMGNLVITYLSQEAASRG